MVGDATTCGSEHTEPATVQRAARFTFTDRQESTLDRLLTTSEAARRLGIDGSTMRRYVAAGRVPAIRTPGGHARLRAVDVDRLAAQAVAASRRA